MKIVVTGGAGFIGSHLVDRLIEEGHGVVVLDHHQKDKLRFPNPAAKVYKLRFGDPQVEAALAKEKPEAIFHLAAQISVTFSVEHPIDDVETNIIDALKLLEYGRRAGVKKIVFVSSGGAIYGDHSIVPTPEVMDAKPISPYGIHKQAFEHYLDSLQNSSDISVAVLRPANIYGPRQQLTGGEGGVMPIFLNNFLNNRESVVFGDGSSTRDYLYVADAVDAFVAALDCKPPHPVNISTGRETSIAELWQILTAIHDGAALKKHLPFRPGEIMRSCLDASAAETILNWQPKTSLEQGLRETYDWFRSTYYDA